MIFNKKPDNFDPIFEVVSCFNLYEGRILFLLRHADKKQGDTWGLVAGKVEKNETLKQAMARESREEVNLEINESDLIYLKKVYVRYPDYDFIFHMFKNELILKPNIKVNNTEIVDYQWVKYKELLNLNLIKDADECIKLVLKEKLL